MVPPKKKRKLGAAAAAAAATAAAATATETSSNSMEIAEDATTSTSSSAMISRKDVLTKELMANLEAIESGDALVEESVSMTLLKLKALQRSLLSKMRKTQARLKEQSRKRDQQEFVLENLQYQEAIHAKAQKDSDSATDLTTLRIAELLVTTKNGETGTNDDQDQDQLLDNFLGNEWKDSSQRKSIVAKLNQEVATRKQLKAELNRLKREQKSKQDELVSRQKLLKDLPSKLADVERASLPLQKFCQKQSSLMKASPKLGTTKRRARLDLAKELPKALYTVFHQLQSCLDIFETNNASLQGMPIDALPSVEIQTNAVVALKVPIPTLSQAGEISYKPKKQASILFHYNATLDLVLASCGTDYDMGQGVMDELFPGDTGEYNTSNKTICATTERTSSSSSSSSSSSTTTTISTFVGKAYQWCNYLGGLHIAPSHQSAAKRYASSRVILKALMRRVRATATLSWMVHGLSRKPTMANLPRHAALRDAGCQLQSKVSHWALATSTSTSTTSSSSSSSSSSRSNPTSSNTRVYKAILHCRSQQLVAKVSVDLARYPSQIPRWKLLANDDDDNDHDNDDDAHEDSLDLLRAPKQLPLYNETLARLEQSVNSSVDDLVLPSDQTTYDWILGEQLMKIAEGWEEFLKNGD